MTTKRMTDKQRYNNWIVDDLDIADFDTVYRNMKKETDFEFGRYRFIKNTVIDKILEDELLSDKYVLGCFTPWFIADHLGISTETVKKIQQADGFEALGELIAATNPSGFAAAYASADGYGHHFARYDGQEHECLEWYAFKI